MYLTVPGGAARGKSVTVGASGLPEGKGTRDRGRRVGSAETLGNIAQNPGNRDSASLRQTRPPLYFPFPGLERSFPFHSGGQQRPVTVFRPSQVSAAAGIPVPEGRPRLSSAKGRWVRREPDGTGQRGGRDQGFLKTRTQNRSCPGACKRTDLTARCLGLLEDPQHSIFLRGFVATREVLTLSVGLAAW